MITVVDQQISFHFTRNNRLLKQYFELRNKLYFKGLGFNVGVDEFDVKSHHLILVKNDEVIGGARLVPRSPGTLPMEGNGFLLSDYINRKKLQNLKVAEVSRISIDEEHRSSDVLQKVFEILCEKCEQNGVDCILTIAPRHIARLTAIMCHRLNYSVNVIREIPMAKTSLYTDLGEMNLVVITKK